MAFLAPWRLVASAVADQEEGGPGEGVGEVSRWPLRLRHQGQHPLAERLGAQHGLVPGMAPKDLGHEGLGGSVLHAPVRHEERSGPREEERPGQPRQPLAAAVASRGIAGRENNPVRAGELESQDVLQRQEPVILLARRGGPRQH